MKKLAHLSVIPALLAFPTCSVIFLLAFLLAACGDNVEEVTQVVQDRTTVVASEDDLPKCSDENEGAQAFVKDEDATRVCVGGKWKPTAPETSAADFSCKTVELKDKSGLKIVCNGDSIGVVLNGEKGDAGKAGTGCTITDRNDTAMVVTCGDSTMTIELGVSQSADTAEADSERIAISLDSLVGVTQKGPFLKGSTVYLYELSDGRTLKQTNGNFTSNITRDDGRYKFTARDLVSQYAMVVVDGYYRNEVTGVSSDAPIRLKALTDMRKRNSVNVNLLTHMEFDRVYHLVTRGDSTGKKLTVKQAKRQAQKEILKQFHIELDDNTDAEDMDVFGKTDADAALLAVSVLLQGDRNTTDLTVLLTDISNAISESGEWNDSATKVLFTDWALQADSEERLELFRKHVRDWHLGGDTTVPDFMPIIRNFINVENGLGECSKKNERVFSYVPNPKSSYYAEAYDSIDASKNSLVRFICDADGGYHWRMATALERDTKDWNSGDDGDVQKGQIDTSLVYVYDGGWRHGTELDIRLDSACTSSRLNSMDSIVQGQDTVWYKCVDGVEKTYEGSTWTAEWLSISELEKDSIFWEMHKDSVGTLLKGPGSGKVMVWDDGAFREPSDKELILGRGCVSYVVGQKFTLSNSLLYQCNSSGWSKKGTFTDSRDSQVYEGVLIGEQTWMAENLRFKYTWSNKLYDVYPGGTYCGEKNTSTTRNTCYYEFSAVVDSLRRYNNTSCASNKPSCGSKGRVRGICPEGWHVPGRDDWIVLFESVGGQNVAGLNLRSGSGWQEGRNGADAYGFSAYPSGYYMSVGAYTNVSEEAFFWNLADMDGGLPGIIQISYNEDAVFMIQTETYGGFRPLRCVKDN